MDRATAFERLIDERAGGVNRRQEKRPPQFKGR